MKQMWGLPLFSGADAEGAYPNVLTAAIEPGSRGATGTRSEAAFCCECDKTGLAGNTVLWGAGAAWFVASANFPGENSHDGQAAPGCH